MQNLIPLYQLPLSLQPLHNILISIFYKTPLIVRHLRRKFTFSVNRADHRHTAALKQLAIFFTKARRRMNNTRTIFRRNKVSNQSLERAATCLVGTAVLFYRQMRKIREQRLIANTFKLSALFLPYNGTLFRFTVVRPKPRFRQNIMFAFISHQHIVDIRTQCKPQVTRQCPWGSRPRQKIGIRRKRSGSKGFRRRSPCNRVPHLKANRNRRVVHILIAAQIQLMIGKYR